LLLGWPRLTYAAGARLLCQCRLRQHHQAQTNHRDYSLHGKTPVGETGLAGAFDRGRSRTASANFDSLGCKQTEMDGL